MNKSHRQRGTCIFYVSIEWCTADRIIVLNSSFYLQEDKLPRNWRLRTVRVSSRFHICSYLQTVHISVFTVFGAFAQSQNAPFCFCCVLLCLFQVPLTSCASPWRAGVTRNGAYPKHCHYYVLDTRCYNSRIVYLVGLKVLAMFLSPHAIIWLWMNFTYTAMTEIFKTSDHIRIFLKVCLILHLSHNF